MALLNEMPQPHTVGTGAEDCECLVLRRNDFQRMHDLRLDLHTATLRGFLRRTAYEWRDLSRLAAAT